MNMNEVIANLASQRLGRPVHPNDHVNASQSSNDVFPSAIHLAAARSVVVELLPALEHLAATLRRQQRASRNVVKAGRTHLMDAVPVTLGQELGGYASQIEHGAARLTATLERVGELPLGGTAVGTGLNAPKGFAKGTIARLASELDLPLTEARDHFEAQGARDALVEASGACRVVAVSLNKIAHDLRWMSSGPRAGLAEIHLPDLQPGSSIMPGKVNPVVAEMLNMVCFHVIGHDVAIAMAAEAGQLELNVMLPYVAYALLDSLDVLAHAVATFDTKTVRLLEAHRDRCAYYAERTVGAATALNDELGFQGAAEVAQEAIRSGRSVAEVMAERRAESGKQ
jgi:fumarate hydratase class II